MCGESAQERKERMRDKWLDVMYRHPEVFKINTIISIINRMKKEGTDYEDSTSCHHLPEEEKEAPIEECRNMTKQVGSLTDRSSFCSPSRTSRQS